MCNLYKGKCLKNSFIVHMEQTSKKTFSKTSSVLKHCLEHSLSLMKYNFRLRYLSSLIIFRGIFSSKILDVYSNFRKYLLFDAVIASGC